MRATNITILSEFDYFDGEEFITFDALDVDCEKMVIRLAVTNRGRISVVDYDLKYDNDLLYFEYGLYNEKIYLSEFSSVA